MRDDQILDLQIIHESVRLYGNNLIGSNCMIFENVILGYPSNLILNESLKLRIPLSEYQYIGTTIGNNAIIRSDGIFYTDVAIGNDFRTGHNILIRENTTIGNNV
jgi:UDP-3-O-[3-hydroxymyristoyl] glucosamine N-acyltransferase